MNYILQILQTLFVVTLIICFVWLLGKLFGKKAGYQWRKILWLVLPNHGYNGCELEAIMRHELIHYHSGDLWYKFLMVLVCDIYWFNPLLRFMKRMAFRDVEFVCDEKATRSMSTEAKRGYSSTILKTMAGTEKANSIFAMQFSGTKKSARERFENIFNIHNRKLGIALLCLLISLTLGTAFISVTVPQGNAKFIPPVSFSFMCGEKDTQAADASVIKTTMDSKPAEDKTGTSSVGICVELKGCEWRQNTNIYEYTEDSVQAIVSLQNYMHLEQPYRLMLFADGVPLEFKVDEEICRAYSFTLSGRKQLEIEFQPEFDLQLGRLDFLLFFEGDPGSVFHMTPYTLLMEQPEKAQLPDRLQTIVEQSSGNLLLEANAYKLGKYRTVLIRNGQPVCITGQGEQLPYLDWEFTGDNVLQLPLELSWCSEEENSFFTVTTPIDSDGVSLFINSMESKKIQVMRP